MFDPIFLLVFRQRIWHGFAHRELIRPCSTEHGWSIFMYSNYFQRTVICPQGWRFIPLLCHGTSNLGLGCPSIYSLIQYYIILIFWWWNMLYEAMMIMILVYLVAFVESFWSFNLVLNSASSWIYWG